MSARQTVLAYALRRTKRPVGERIEMTDDATEVVGYNVEYDSGDDDEDAVYEHASAGNEHYKDTQSPRTRHRATSNPRLRRGRAKKYVKPQGIASKLPLSFLDCCPCATNLVFPMSLWLLYCAHFIVALCAFAKYMNGSKTILVPVIIHMISTHFYGKAIHINASPGVLFHVASVAMLSFSAVYHLN